MITARYLGLAGIVIGWLILVLSAGLQSLRSMYARPVNPLFENEELFQKRLRVLFLLRMETYALATFLLVFGCAVIYWLEPHVANTLNNYSKVDAGKPSPQDQSGSKPDSIAGQSATSPKNVQNESARKLPPTPARNETPATPGAITKNSSASAPWNLSWLIISGVFLFGAALAVYGFRTDRAGAKIGGVVAITASLITGSGSFSLFKIDKIENSVDHLFDIKLKNQGGFSPTHLIRLEGFCSSKPDLKHDIEVQIGKFCEGRSLKDNSAFLLVVGATDNAPLRRGRFESNLGLAQARAERVRKILTGEPCKVRVDHVLAVVSGPRHSETQKDMPTRNAGSEEDRSVDVWAFWDKPLARDSSNVLKTWTSVGALETGQPCPPKAPKTKTM